VCSSDLDPPIFAKYFLGFGECLVLVHRRPAFEEKANAARRNPTKEGNPAA
jgi:hypothetical protein